MNSEITTTEIEALQNAADGINAKVHHRYNEDKRYKAEKYFLSINGLCVSPVLDYENLNHFILGFRKCQELSGKVTKDDHPAPTDYNQEKTKQYSITKEHDEIISFTRESDGKYFEKDRTARIVYKDEVQKIGRIERIYATDQFKSGLGVTIDGRDYNADLVEHIVPIY